MLPLKTVNEVYKDEYMPLCACGSGIKAIFICFYPSCPGFSQPQYCINCEQDDDSKHQAHRTVMTSKKVANMDTDWSKIVFELGDLIYEDFNKTLEELDPIL